MASDVGHRQKTIRDVENAYSTVDMSDMPQLALHLNAPCVYHGFGNRENSLGDRSDKGFLWREAATAGVAAKSPMRFC